MSESSSKTEKFFCNLCKRRTNHFIQGEFTRRVGAFGNEQRLLIIECCGCENAALAKMLRGPDDLAYNDSADSHENKFNKVWEETVYPPVSYRPTPDWFEDLPDPTLRRVADEIYKSLQSESHFLATFGARTLIDRLIVLTVGDKANFKVGLDALETDGKLSKHERELLNPIVDAGNAAAHRGWAPSPDQLKTILDTVESLIHRLLVVPKLTEALQEAVPRRGQKQPASPSKYFVSAKEKVESAPKDLRSVYDYLASQVGALGSDVSVHPQKHYIAFRRHRNFASVQLFNRNKEIKVYLNLDPDETDTDYPRHRDVRQIGHFGTGDLELVIKTKKDVDLAMELLKASYEAS